MGRDNSIICDTCNADLTSVQMMAYKITLESERIPTGPGMVLSNLIYPPFEGTKDFCNLNCLKEWLDKRYNKCITCGKETNATYCTVKCYLKHNSVIQSQACKECRGIAARAWCDQDMREVVMDVKAAELIATIIHTVREEQGKCS